MGRCISTEDETKKELPERESEEVKDLSRDKGEKVKSWKIIIIIGHIYLFFTYVIPAIGYLIVPQEWPTFAYRVGWFIESGLVPDLQWNMSLPTVIWIILAILLRPEYKVLLRKEI